MGPRPEPGQSGAIGYGMGGALFHAPFIAADPRLDLAVVVTANAERRRAVLAGTPVPMSSSGPRISWTASTSSTSSSYRRRTPPTPPWRRRCSRREPGGGRQAGHRGRRTGNGRLATLAEDGAHGWSPFRTGAGTATFGPSWTFCAVTDFGSCTIRVVLRTLATAGVGRSGGPGRTMGTQEPAPGFSSTSGATSSTRPSCSSAGRRASTASRERRPSSRSGRRRLPRPAVPGRPEGPPVDERGGGGPGPPLSAPR